jgi:hypothetical protein
MTENCPVSFVRFSCASLKSTGPMQVPHYRVLGTIINRQVCKILRLRSENENALARSHPVHLDTTVAACT